MNVIDLSHLKKDTADFQPEPGEEITVRTFKLPRALPPAPRIAIAGVQLNDGREAMLSMHAEGLGLMFEAPGEQVRVMPREAIIESWLPVLTVTDVMPPIDPDPVAERIDAETSSLELETKECGAERCFLPHEDLFTYVDGAWCAQAFSTTPREHSKGHESLLICRTSDTVTVKTEFGDHAAAVEIPAETFDRLVRQTLEGWADR